MQKLDPLGHTGIEDLSSDVVQYIHVGTVIITVVYSIYAKMSVKYLPMHKTNLRPLKKQYYPLLLENFLMHFVIHVCGL